MTNFNGVSAYQQTNQTWNRKTDSTKNTKTDSTKETDQTTGKQTGEIKTTDFQPIDTKSSLVPSAKNGYGMAIGNVELSDKAKEYYNKLKAKFQNMDFILVSRDMKQQVQANASAYGNSSKQVVLIDDEKIEKMASDESYRKKYEGMIAMSQVKLQETKNSLASSGASVKNFGMSVDSNGNTSFFATVEKNTQKKAEEKKAAKKKETKLKEKKLAEKKAAEKKAKEKKDAEKTSKEDTDNQVDEKEYVEITADSMEELVDQVSFYAYDSLSGKVLTDSEKQVGQKIDFRG